MARDESGRPEAARRDDSSDQESLIVAKEKLSDRLLGPAIKALSGTPIRHAHLATPTPALNVVGVGIGQEMTDGRPTGRQAIKVFVRRKFPKRHVHKRHRLPRTIDGFPIDVEEIGTVRASQDSPTSRIRPPIAGCSIGWYDPTLPKMAGTFGAVVRDTNGTYILSANHVLAGENQLTAGAAIYQPGKLDDPNADSIATLERFETLQDGGELDCAIARLSAAANPAILGIGVPAGTMEPAQFLPVSKFGRSSLLTRGIVAAVRANFVIDYPRSGSLLLKGQIGIQGINGQPFSDDGDSGALIVETASRRAVGLLIGTSLGLSVANHISLVLARLSVSIVTQ